MKKLSACLILLSIVAFTSSAVDESEVILQAQMDAKADGGSYHATLWGIGGAVFPFLATLIAENEKVNGPHYGESSDFALFCSVYVLTASSITLVGTFTGRIGVPDTRIAEIKNEYNDSSLLSLYESEYEKTLTKIQRRKRGTAALGGNFLGAAITFFVGGFYYILAGWG
jgi:hypothetical protein